jgi:RES domain-containing protein
VLVWRTGEHAALDGEGGLHASGRWHTIGHRITYCTESAAAALLELLAHLRAKAKLIPKNIQYQELDILEGVEIETIKEESLPTNWRSRESVTRSVGDEWIRLQRTAILQVPSVLSPRTRNFLVNHMHQDARKVRITETIRFPLDPRLVR